MNDLTESLTTALHLITQADATLWRTVCLSLWVSGLACAVAAVLGLLMLMPASEAAVAVVKRHHRAANSPSFQRSAKMVNRLSQAFSRAWS